MAQMLTFKQEQQLEFSSTLVRIWSLYCPTWNTLNLQEKMNCRLTVELLNESKQGKTFFSLHPEEKEEKESSKEKISATSGIPYQLYM